MLDELLAGIATCAVPDLERSFGVGHAAVTAIVFLVPGLIAFAIEPMVFVRADRGPRLAFIRAGVAGMTAGAIACALAPGPIALALGLSILYIGVGAASSLAQATLVDRAPDARARVIARYALLSLLGDVGAPILLAALALGGASWRAAFAICAAVLGAWTLALATSRDDAPPPAPDPDLPSISVWAALRSALADRNLLAWLFAAALCDLLDEIFVVLASIRVRIDLGAGPLAQALAIAAFTAGGALGLALVDRMLRARSELRVLAGASIACAIVYAAWLFARGVPTAIALAFPVGAAAAPLYPLASAQAYAARPGASGAVLAASHVFTPLGLALPFALGVVADAAGTRVALALLLAQPLALATLALRDFGLRSSVSGLPDPDSEGPKTQDRRPKT